VLKGSRLGGLKAASIRLNVLPPTSWQSLSLEAMRADALEAIDQLEDEERVLTVAVETVEDSVAQTTDSWKPVFIVVTIFAVIDYVGGPETTHQGLVAAARIIWYLLALLAKYLGGGYTPLT
jgi:hypothetical protein